MALLKHILTPIPLYYFSLFKAPISIINILENKMRNFLWEYKDSGSKSSHLINWKMVMAVRKRGGLGILNLRLMNQALLAKWSWRFGVEKAQLWCKLMVEKYGSDFSYWTPKKVKSPHGVSCWRIIVDCSNLVTKYYSLRIHSGTLTSFWHDRWLGDSCFMDSFNNLYKLDKGYNASVADHITADGCWKFVFKRNLTDAESNSLAAFLQIIGSTPPSLQGRSDCRGWLLHSSGVFSVKTLYAELNSNAGNDNFPHGFVWITCIPPKVNFYCGVLFMES
ncbi:uncharacterized protein LOC113333881 [Papaver somniferum]|uniref:uncharacterized protein LOC113333881 n=1 Tax=Papaver somniferum TaxID=3469 RepID=UPI000E6F999F|nr:uncharacterized protein LOC113333881 [Papaver somniferum]